MPNDIVVQEEMNDCVRTIVDSGDELDRSTFMMFVRMLAKDFIKKASTTKASVTNVLPFPLVRPSRPSETAIGFAT